MGGIHCKCLGAPLGSLLQDHSWCEGNHTVLGMDWDWTGIDANKHLLPQSWDQGFVGQCRAATNAEGGLR